MGQWAKSLYVQGIGPTPFWWDDGLSYQTMLYAVALAVFAALIVGVIPALKATGPQLQGRIREAASGTSTMKFGGLWTAIIVTQAAITVIVLATVVSFGWTQLRKQWGSDVTYARDQLLTAHVVVDQVNTGRAQPPNAETLQAVADRLGAEPGVASVSYTTALPGTIWEQVVFEFQSPELQEHADARRITDVLWSEGARVGANFFETVGIPLAAGRTFSAAEIRQGAPVAIVDETFVRIVLGGRSPFGVRLRQRAEEAGQEPGPWLEIVGVVKDATTMPRKGPHDAAVYRPAAPAQPMRLLVRTQVAAAPRRHAAAHLRRGAVGASRYPARRSEVARTGCLRRCAARADLSARLHRRRRASRCCWPPPASTRSFHSPSRAARARSASAWRSGPRRTAS